MRGFFDYRSTQKPPNIASVTDGTSNSIIVGEVLPSNAADSNFWMFNGVLRGHDRSARVQFQHHRARGGRSL